MPSLLDEVIDAHGGRRRWRKVNAVRAQVEGGGMLLRLKGKARQFRRIGIEARTDRQQLTITPYPEAGERGVFDAGRVRIESEEGEILSQRDDGRGAFFGAAGVVRQLRWTDLDALYFTGYALWNYFNAPFCFEWPGVDAVEGEAVESEEGETWRCLEVTYPADFHTHCTQQAYYFDTAGILRRHDYHPEVVATFAHACNMSGEPRKAGGITFETERRIVPKGPAGPLPRPTIVELDFSDIQIV